MNAPRHHLVPDDDQVTLAATYWDAEYTHGRLLDLPPEPLVERILRLARDLPLPSGPGLYIGPGNGRNYLPLAAGGLDLIGLDISSVGLDAIRAEAPDRAHRLVHGDLSALPSGDRYPLVLGINVFQHGDRAQTHAHITAALERVAPGGVFVMRVNAIGTDVARPHEVVEEAPDGSRTIRYADTDAPGLLSHYFSRAEITGLLADCEPIDPLALDDVDRRTGRRGRWRRWQTIVRRPHPAGDGGARR